MAEGSNVIFASGAVLQADGTITRMVEAQPLAAVPPPVPEPAEPAEEGEVPEPAEPVAPEEPETADGEPAPSAEPADDLGQHPGESNRKFRRRLWEENQNYSRRHAELIERNAYLEGQLAASQRVAGEPQTPPAPTPPPQPQPGLRSRPQPGHYPDYQAYEDDLRLYWRELDAAERAAEAKADADRQVRQQWERQTEQGRLKYRDFDARVATVPFAGTLAHILGDAFVHSPQGADILYYVSTHPEAVAELQTLDPWAAARWVAALEARLAPAAGRGAPGQPPSQASGVAPPAPAPLRPVGTGPAQPVVGFRTGMALTDYENLPDVRRRNGFPP